MKTNFTTVGTIGKPHGTSGAFHFLFHYPLETGSFPTVLYVETATGVLPFFPKEVNCKDEISGFMYFEEVTTREQAVALVNASIMMKTKEVAQFFDTSETEDFTGFEVIDKVYGNLGKVTETSSNTIQTVLAIEVNGSEVLFPLVEAFIEKIDYTQQQLFLHLPEGIIETYTQNNEESDED